MKLLLLLRHAKSSRDDPTLRDFDRPLNDRGKKDAKLIGKFLRRKKIRPDLIVSSPAARAKQTIELVSKSADLEVELRFDRRIYEASGHRLLEVVSQIEDSTKSPVLVGHNPGFEELLEILTNGARTLPTASLVCIELPVDKWSTVQPGLGKSLWLVSPKELKR